MSRAIAAILPLLFVASCTCQDPPKPPRVKAIELTPAMAYEMLTEKPLTHRISTDFQKAVAQGDTRFLSVDGQTPIASTRPGVVEHFGTRPGMSHADAFKHYAERVIAHQDDDRAIDDFLDQRMDAPLYNMAMLYYLEMHHQIPLTQPAGK